MGRGIGGGRGVRAHPLTKRSQVDIESKFPVLNTGYRNRSLLWNGLGTGGRLAAGHEGTQTGIGPRALYLSRSGSGMGPVFTLLSHGRTGTVGTVTARPHSILRNKT